MPPLISPSDVASKSARPFDRKSRASKKSRRAYSFPKNFAWGVATAAAQIEGAAFEDGKGESIWDRFARLRNIDAPTIACDHYHRYREDVDLLRRLGVAHHRLSVAWPR